MSARKRKRKAAKLPITLVLILLIAAALWYGYNRFIKQNDITPVEGTLDVHFIDVGQGDSELIVTSDGKTVLIDANKGSDCLDYLNKLGITHLDYAIFTHYHEDHIGSGDEVIDSLQVDRIVLPYSDNIPDTLCVKNLIDSAQNEVDNHGASIIYPEAGAVFTLGEASLKVLSDKNIVDRGNENNNSIVMTLTFGKNKFLFSGDAEKKREAQVLEAYANELDADVFKAGHHCSETANNADFLERITPSTVVIECGKDNSYGHPHAAALSRIMVYTKNILRTDLLGDIKISSDGESITQDKNTSTASAYTDITVIAVDFGAIYGSRRFLYI